MHARDACVTRELVARADVVVHAWDVVVDVAAVGELAWCVHGACMAIN